MSLLKIVFVFGVLAVSLRSVLAVSSEEKQKFHATTFPHIVECSAEYGITMDDLKKVKETDTYSTLDNCLKACVYKKNELIDDQGLFVADKAEEFIKKYLSGEADQKKASEIISDCKSVNVQEVTDGEKGCERAGLLFECLRPLKAMFANSSPK